MPRFSYSAYTNAGALESGEVQAETDVAALDQISAQGLTPVSLKLGGQSLPWWQRDISISGRQRADPAALEQFFKTFSDLLRVRLPMIKALRFCEENATDRAMMQELGRVQSDVGGGSTLGQALRGTEGFFPDRLITMVEIGEAADRLPEIALRIADSLAVEAEQRRELRSAMIYPLILIVMSLLVVLLLVFFLTPTLTPVFTSAQADLPSILQAMATIREVVLKQWPIVLICLAGAIILLYALRHPFRAGISKVALKLPGISSFVRQSETLKLFQTVSLMLASGAPLPRAIITAKETTRHPAYRNLLAKAEEKVVAGNTLSEVFSKTVLIHPMTTAMLEAAEETDRMVPVLEQLVTDLRARSARALQQVIRLITPIITLVIGVSVGGIILSTLSAIMALNDVTF